MDASEFWCRAFLAATSGHYADRGAEVMIHDGAATYCGEAADAALAVAQRRGMVDGPRKAQPRPGGVRERVEFTASRHSDAGWIVCTSMYMAGVVAVEGAGPIRMADGNTVHVVWGETMPPKPIEVWIEKAGG